MKKFSTLIFLYFILGLTNIHAQSRLIWSSISAYPDARITDSKGFESDNSGNTYSVNFTESAISSFVSYVFYAHDANGLKSWEYVNDSCLFDCNDKYFNIVPVENDGAIFIGAYDDITGTQVRIKRIDGSGVLLWQQYWISPFLSLQPIKSFIDNNGDLVIALSSVVSILDHEDFTIAKFDTSNGFLDWHIELPDAGAGLNTLSEIISSITVDANNNIYGVGTGTNASAGIIKNFFFKVDDAGNLDYDLESTYSGDNSSNHSILLDGAGNFYTLGFTGAHPVIEKRRASSGNLIWSQEITKDSASLSNIGFSVIDNSIYVATNFTYLNPDTSAAGGYWDNVHYMLTSLDTSGVLRWQHEYFTNADSLSENDGYGGGVQFSVCNDELYILSSQHLDSINNILILHKTDLLGNTLWYDTASVNTVPGFFDFDDQCELYLSRTFDNYNLTQKYTTAPVNGVVTLRNENAFEVYPNPAHDEFIIHLTNEKINDGFVLIYNSLGELIKRQSVSGNNTKISISDIAQGLYLVQLISAENMRSTKILIKN